MKMADEPASKLYWGPLLWQLFHNLAELSDRRDIPFLWPKLLQITSAIMPCNACKNHLAGVLHTRTFLKIPPVHLITGPGVQTQIRNELWRLHNEVNVRLGKPSFGESSADIAAIYGIRDGRTRGVILSEIQNILEKLRVAWTPLVHTRINGGIYSAWRTHIALMVALVSGGGTT